MSRSAADPAAVAAAGGSHVVPLLEAIEQRLRAIAAEAAPALAAHAEETIAAGGKRLRPLLVVLVAGERAAAPAPPPLLVPAAVAVELVHSATLVHDDVLDAAPLRRGRETVFASAGRRAAAATGDLLFARAFGELAGAGDARAVRVLSAASAALARGELMQREDAWNAEVSVDRYLERCRLKTAALFEAACRLGAIAGARDEEPFAAFGERIGLAFQLLDDVLDVAGTPDRTGKARGTDLLDGTVTLPLILARAEDRELAALDLRALDAAGAERVCERIAASGALEPARTRALALVAEAKQVLPELDARGRQVFELVADGVVERFA